MNRVRNVVPPLPAAPITGQITGLIAVLILTLVPAAWAQAPDEAALLEMLPAWADAYNANDLDALAMLYTEDAVIMPPNRERVHGRDASKALAASYIEAGAVEIELPSPDAYAVVGETAWIEGTYRFFAPDGSPADVGKYLDVYRFEDGAWRIQHHMWNSDLPPMVGE